MRDADRHVDARTVALLEALHPEGVAGGADAVTWVEAPLLVRGRTRRRLQSRGLSVSGTWLAFPPKAPRALIPVSGTGRAERARLASVVTDARWVPRALGLWGRLVEELCPGVGIVVQRRGGRPPLDWARSVGLDTPVAVSAGWSDPARGLTLHGAKLTIKSSRDDVGGRLAAEGEALRSLAPAATAAGADTPDLIYQGLAGGRSALVERTLAGAHAASRLRSRPAALWPLLDSVAGWLERWHTSTRRLRRVTQDDLDTFLFDPFGAIAADLPGRAHYGDALAKLAEDLKDVDVPFAAAHNDLTTWNLLVDGPRTGIVDWEAATPDAPPLVDLQYAIVDAVAAARRIARAEAFATLCSTHPDGVQGRRLSAQVVGRLELSPVAADFGRHACWLGHARNEALRPSADGARPFLDIVQTLAEQ